MTRRSTPFESFGPLTGTPSAFPWSFKVSHRSCARYPESTARPPAGRLFLVRLAGKPAATAAFRPLGGDACEAKRLFVLPEYRRRGIAAALTARLVQEARLCGYRTLYGDTLLAMAQALDLYRAMGFVEVGRYSDDPTPDAIYLRLSLDAIGRERCGRKR